MRNSMYAHAFRPGLQSIPYPTVLPQLTPWNLFTSTRPSSLAASNLQTLNTNSCSHKSGIIWVFLDHSMVHGSQVFTNWMIVCHPHSDFSKIHFNKPKTKTFSRFGMRSFVAFEPRSLGNFPKDLPPALHQESQNISRLWGKGHDYSNMVQRSVKLHINIQTIKCRSSSHHIISTN